MLRGLRRGTILLASGSPIESKELSYYDKTQRKICISDHLRVTNDKVHIQREHNMLRFIKFHMKLEIFELV